MGMKLVKAEYLFDGSKIIFYFTADGRVDFRELVKDLAHHFHTRIEMRQIGVRDEAKLIGGIGICGLSLCCCTFLTEFSPVSVKMAKEQQLALNPNKISGQCGRLLCCLSYEYETYCKMRKGMPKNGLKMSVEGLNAQVSETDILGQKVSVRLEDGRCLKMTKDEFSAMQASGKLPKEEQPQELSVQPAPKPATEQKKEQEQQQKEQPKKRRRRRKRKPSGGGGKDGSTGQQGQDRRDKQKESDKPAASGKKDQEKQGQQPAKDANAPKGGEQKKRRRRRRRRKPSGGGQKPESTDKN